MTRNSGFQKGSLHQDASAWERIPPPPAILDEQGECRGLPRQWFFDGDAADTRRAKEACAICPVIKDCLAYAMSMSKENDWGVWGGTTRHERTRMRGHKVSNDYRKGK